MSLIAGSFSSNPDHQLPLQKIFEATMRGNGEMQAQAQVKKVAGEQMDSTSRMTVTMKPNPTGGVPLVTVKDAPADLLNQTREADVKNAYDAPRKNVEDRLRQYGFSPKTSDVQPSDVDSFGERYRARRELGGSVLKSAIMAGITGGRRDAQLIQNLKNQRAAQNLATEQKFVDPSRDQDLQEYDQTVVSPARLAIDAATEGRQATSQYLTARNQLLDQKNIIQYGDEDSFLNSAESAMAPVGGLRVGDRELFARAFRTGRVSFLNDRVSRLSGAEGKTVIDSYEPGERERFIAEQSGVPPESLNEREVARFSRIFDGLQDNKYTTRLAEVSKNRDALGTFDSAEEASTALGLDGLPQEKQQQFRADWQAARRAYVRKDQKEQLDLQLKAGAVAAAHKANEIAAVAAQATSRGAIGEAALEGLPEATKAFIRGIAEGRVDITKVTSMRGGNREATARMVEAYDPTWSTAVAPARAATYRDYYAGDTKHKAIDPLNTAIHHLDEAKNSAVALKNAPVHIWNRIRQYGLESLKGDPRYGKFIADTSLLAGEIGKLSKGGVPDKEELATINRLFSTINSPAQIDAVLNEYVKLMGGRAIPLTEGFVARAGTLPPKGLILSPSSERILRNRGFSGIADAIIGADQAPVTSSPNVISLDDALAKIGKKK